MGLFSAAKKLAKSAIKRAKPLLIPTIGAIGGAGAVEIAEQVLQPTRPRGLPALPPGIARPTGLPGLPIPGGPPARLTRRAPPIFTAGGCPAGFHPARDGSGRCVRNRRMNPMNYRAAVRATRRIKMAMKLLRKIERQLPKQPTRRRSLPYHRTRVTHD